jgi:aminoglycoside 3-N-acetyltransferase
MTERAATVSSLTADLKNLGVRPGQDLLVHTSMRELGPVEGGADGLLKALQASVGPRGTLIVPTQTPLNSLTSDAFLADTRGFCQAALDRYIQAMPGFDPDVTPSTGMGRFAEHVRTSQGAVRSSHPQSSFAALGARAAESMADHKLTCHLGEQSPLGWLYRADAAILLLGVRYNACTAFHLAEYRLPGEPVYRQYQCFTMVGGERVPHAFTDIELDHSDFEALGIDFDRAHRPRPGCEADVRSGRVGATESCRLLPLRKAVDFAVASASFVQRRRPAVASRWMGTSR